MKRGFLWIFVVAALVAPAGAQQIPSRPTTTQGVGSVGIFSGADTSSQNVTVGPGASGTLAYICGFTVSGLGATSGTNVSVTVGALVGNKTLTYSYSFAAGAAVLSTALIVNFAMCIPANAQDSAITVTVPGAAGNTATQINAWGFTL